MSEAFYNEAQDLPFLRHVRDELLHPAGTGRAKLLIHHERAVESE
jgi:hypothetical protein